MVGWSTANAEPRVALDVTTETIRYEDVRLPNVGSEAVLPLIARGRVIGALDVQSIEVGKFEAEFVSLLQTMADQVAVALDNAQLFAASQAALEAERRAYGELERQAWAELTRQRGDWGYRFVQGALSPTAETWHPAMLRAMEIGTVWQGDDSENGIPGNVLAIPVRLRDQVLGALRFRKGTDGEVWTDDEIELLEMLTEQLGVALESARLYQDTQKRAAREQLLSEVTRQMRETLDVDAVLQTAVEQMRQALNIAEVEVRMGIEQIDDAANRPT